MTFVEVRRARAVNYGSFAHITAVPLVEITPTGLDFDGDLSEAEASNVWWFASSRDDADEAARRNIAALRDAAVADPTPANINALLFALAAYLLGET